MRQGIAWAALAGALVWTAGATVARGQACAPPGTASAPCSGNCATITVGSAAGSPNGSVSIPISFSQGQPNGMKEPDGGFDQVAAIAFTLGMPGDSTSPPPLSFNCANGDLAPGALTVSDAIANNFTVVVENAQCTSSRSRCLCPDTAAGQTQDNFANFVVYGPKNVSQGTPVSIPVLPASGTLFTLNLQVAGTAPSAIPLRIFSALDSNPATPQFGANLSIGDQAACDVTANTQNHSNVTFAQGSVAVSGSTPPPSTCIGDCNNDHQVVISELIVGVNIALGSAAPSTCPAFEDQNGMVTISQLIKGVNNALNGCPAAS